MKLLVPTLVTCFWHNTLHMPRPHKHAVTFIEISSRWKITSGAETRIFCYNLVNSSPPSAAYMHQWIRPALVHIMARCPLNAMPLSKPMLGYCKLKLLEQTSVKVKLKYTTFHSRKCIWKHCLGNGGHFVQEEMSSNHNCWCATVETQDVSTALKM